MSTVPLPEDWEVKNLSEVSTAIQYGHTAKARQEEIGPRMLRITDIQDGTVNWSDVPFCAIEEKSKSKYLLKENDLVFARTGATVGKSYLIHGNIPESVYASYLIRVRLAESVDPKYIAYFFQSSDYWRQISESQAGIGQPNVNGKKLAAIKVPLAPLEQQENIVAEIEKQFSRLDEAVANLKRVKANLKRYKAAVLKAAVEGKLTEEWRAAQGRANVAGGQEPGATKAHPDVEPASKLLDRILAERRAKWEETELAKMKAKGKAPKNDKWKAKYKEPGTPNTSKLPELPEGWVWASTGQVGQIQLGRQRSPKNRSKDNPVKYIRAANITERGLDLDDVLDMEFSLDEQERYRLRRGDLVLSEASGSPDQVGKPAVWADELPLCCFQNTVIRLRSAIEMSPYLLVCFQSYYVNGVFARVAGGVGINHLSADKFSRVRVSLPPLAEQRRIVLEVNHHLSLIRETEAQVDTNLQRAERLRQSLLTKAFSGDFTSNEAQPLSEQSELLMVAEPVEIYGANTATNEP